MYRRSMRRRAFGMRPRRALPRNNRGCFVHGQDGQIAQRRARHRYGDEFRLC
jgi:hypothetical protein